MAFITKVMPSKWQKKTLPDLPMNISNSCGIYNIRPLETPPVEIPPEAFFCFALYLDCIANPCPIKSQRRKAVMNLLEIFSKFFVAF